MTGGSLIGASTYETVDTSLNWRRGITIMYSTEDKQALVSCISPCMFESKPCMHTLKLLTV